MTTELLRSTLDAWSKSAQATLTATAPAISARTGIIRHVSERMIDSDEPRLFHASTGVTNVARLYGYPASGGFTGGSGAGLTREIALASAIGETLERYCSATYDPADLTTASYEDLRQAHVSAAPPEHFALYAAPQYEGHDFILQPFTPTREISWTEGYSLVREDRVLVPACLTYLPFRYENPGDLVAFGVSTGLSCKPSLPEAILGGLCEVVERDAFMCMWMNRTPAPTLAAGDDAWLAALLEKHFVPSRLGVHIFDISTEFSIPVVFALLIDERNEGLAVAAGASAHPDPRAAALKALTEAAQVRRWLKSMPQPHPPYRDDFADVATFEDHVRLFGSLSSIRYLDFLIEHPPTASIGANRHTSSVTATLENCVAAIAAHGHDVIVVDLTQPDVARLGLHVVKVIVPGLVDINADHNYRPLGAARLYRGLRTLGNTRPSAGSLNPVPHPFP